MCEGVLRLPQLIIVVPLYSHAQAGLVAMFSCHSPGLQAAQP